MCWRLYVSFDKCTDTPKWPDVTQPKLCIKAIKQQTRRQTGRRNRQLVLSPANQSVIYLDSTATRSLQLWQPRGSRRNKRVQAQKRQTLMTSDSYGSGNGHGGGGGVSNLYGTLRCIQAERSSGCELHTSHSHSAHPLNGLHRKWTEYSSGNIYYR